MRIRSNRRDHKPDGAPQSVFSNFKSARHAADEQSVTEAHSTSYEPMSTTSLQASIDIALARSFVYRFLAKAYEYPATDGWLWLCDPKTHSALQSAVRALAQDETAPLHKQTDELLSPFRHDQFEFFTNDYVAVFSHAARGSCPLNEIEYGDLKADPLFQPHRLADLAAFYRAFGLEVTDKAPERHDHISVELEFMSVLAAKEAFWLEHQLEDEHLRVCQDAEKRFLREHLGRWSPAFARRLTKVAGEEALATLARFTRAVVEWECQRCGVHAGSEDLVLRPVDVTAESLCSSCGISGLPPGALASAAAAYDQEASADLVHPNDMNLKG